MRFYIVQFEKQFEKLHEKSTELINSTARADLYRQPIEKNALFPINTCGEYILRSAGAVEQTFGGITTRLWDDPFEWTLPEALSTNELISEYLDSVAETRRRGFELLQTDDDLKKEIPAPQILKPIAQILLETLVRAENYNGRAQAIFKLLAEDKR